MIMRVNELSVGDYVSYNGENYKVRAVAEDGKVTIENDEVVRPATIEEIEPIRLTIDVVYKLGFNKYMRLEKSGVTLYRSKDGEIELEFRSWEKFLRLTVGCSALPCENVHNLQTLLHYLGKGDIKL